MEVLNGSESSAGKPKRSECAENPYSTKIPRGLRVSGLSSRFLISRMGCCGCSDEAGSKVVPVTPDQEEPSLGVTEKIFVTDRSCTDITALIVMILLIGGFGYFGATAVAKGDIYRIVNGYDDCANVCGRKNLPAKDPLFACKGVDMTHLPYHLVNVAESGIRSKQCVKSCSTSDDQITFLNRCIPKKVTESANSVIKALGLQSFFYEAAQDVSIVWRELVYLLLISLAFSILTLVAFRYLVAWIVYIILTTVVIVSIAATAFLWTLWYQEKKALAAGEFHEEDSNLTSYMIYAIIMTVVAVIVVLVVLVMRKRIALVVQLFREAGKAVHTMPSLLLQPVWTYMVLFLSIAGSIYFMLLIESAGDLYINRKKHISFKKDTILKVARWYNLFVCFVMCEFIMGCQHMAVAGAVARWFFTRDKKRLSLTVMSSSYTVVRFHLGTVAFGAMVIGVVRLIRTIFAYIQKQLKGCDNGCAQGVLWCCQCCLWCFEKALQFLSRNAYIETAIYGCGFCKASRKAFQALSSNILRVAAINSVGDFVLFLGKLLIVALTVVCGVYILEKKTGLQHPWVPISLAGVLAFIVAHCFISIYEMIIDSIFICFCEDCSKNDGISRPYYMSRGLMEFVENSKKVLQHLDQQRAVST